MLVNAYLHTPSSLSNTPIERRLRVEQVPTSSERDAQQRYQAKPSAETENDSQLLRRIETLEKVLKKDALANAQKHTNLIEVELPYKQVSAYTMVRDFDASPSLIDVFV